MVVFLRDGFFCSYVMDFFFFFWRTLCSPPIFVVGPALKSYCCPPLFLRPRATKHKPSQFSHIHLPTNKVKMRLIYNPSGTSHARDALRIENRTEQRRHFTAGEKMKIVRDKLLYILLALFFGAHHLLLHAHHRAT